MYLGRRVRDEGGGVAKDCIPMREGGVANSVRYERSEISLAAVGFRDSLQAVPVFCTRLFSELVVKNFFFVV